jgi:hypothetical protein
MIGIAGMKVVEKQERIKLWHLIVAEGTLQVDPRPLDRRFALPDLLYLSRHIV